MHESTWTGVDVNYYSQNALAHTVALPRAQRVAGQFELGKDRFGFVTNFCPRSELVYVGILFHIER